MIKKEYFVDYRDDLKKINFQNFNYIQTLSSSLLAYLKMLEKVFNFYLATPSVYEVVNWRNEIAGESMYKVLLILYKRLDRTLQILNILIQESNVFPHAIVTKLYRKESDLLVILNKLNEALIDYYLLYNFEIKVISIPNYIYNLKDLYFESKSKLYIFKWFKKLMMNCNDLENNTILYWSRLRFFIYTNIDVADYLLYLGLFIGEGRKGLNDSRGTPVNTTYAKLQSGLLALEYFNSYDDDHETVILYFLIKNAVIRLHKFLLLEFLNGLDKEYMEKILNYKLQIYNEVFKKRYDEAFKKRYDEAFKKRYDETLKLRQDETNRGSIKLNSIFNYGSFN